MNHLELFLQKLKTAAPLTHRQFTLVRLSLVLCWLVVTMAAKMLSLAFPYGMVTLLVLLHALLIGLTSWASRPGEAPTVPTRAAFYSLLLDELLITGLLYLTGGWTNPLVTLYLISITLAATTLPRTTSLWVALVAISGYTFVSQVYLPVTPEVQAGHIHGDLQDMSGFSLHIAGMWLTFVISALTIALFVSNLATAQRATEARLAKSRERILRNERVIGMATLAAGTAHELGTPLATITVIASEMLADLKNPDYSPEDERESLIEDLEEQMVQLRLCRSLLGKLSERAHRISPKQTALLPLNEFVEQVADQWRLVHPQSLLQVSTRPSGFSNPPVIRFEESLALAIHNLLDNAERVSPRAVNCHYEWDQTSFTLHIADRGPGLTRELQHALAFRPSPLTGNESFPQQKGLGIGLLLVNTTIESLGGQVRYADREGGGADVMIQLPLQMLQD